MTVSAVSRYRGGTIDVVTPLARRMQAADARHGVLYRLSRFHAGANAGDWLTIVQYADWTAYEAAQQAFAGDAEYQQTSTEIAGIARRISRELVDDIDL